MLALVPVGSYRMFRQVERRTETSIQRTGSEGSSRRESFRAENSMQKCARWCPLLRIDLTCDDATGGLGATLLTEGMPRSQHGSPVEGPHKASDQVLRYLKLVSNGGTETRTNCLVSRGWRRRHRHRVRPGPPSVLYPYSCGTLVIGHVSHRNNF